MVLEASDSHQQLQTSPDSNLHTPISPSTRTSTPSVSRLPTQSSSIVPPRSALGGASLYSTISRPYSSPSLPPSSKWQAEELWDVDPDKLDDEEVEILGALLPVVALNDWENHKPGGEGGGTTSVTSKSIHTVRDLRGRQPQRRPQIPSSTTTFSLPQTLPTRSSLASLRNLLDRPLPPLPVAQQPVYPPTPPSPFSFNSTPPLNQAAPKVDPSQILGERVESLQLVCPQELQKGRHFDEREVRGWNKSIESFNTTAGSYGEGERRKKLQPRDELGRTEKGSRRIVEKSEVIWSGFEARGKVGGSLSEEEKIHVEEKEELDEDHDEFAMAFLQTPPPTPPTLAMTKKSIPRHTTPNPFFPVQPVASRPNSIFSYSTGSLVSPPEVPPATPLPALPTQAAYTSHSRQSSGASHSLASTHSSISTAPTSPVSRRSHKF
ncbi:hypothetical protein JCM3765_007831 [Sporobolomyces pararoseus]